MIIGVTGHQELPLEAQELAHRRITDLVHERAATHGVTALARGADQLFAHVLLEAGVPYTHVAPSLDYDEAFSGDDRKRYEDLASRAFMLVRLPFPRQSEEAFLAAGLVIAERSDLVVAIWDGRPARGLGGTGDIVSYCNDTDTEVEVVWPRGVEREP